MNRRFARRDGRVAQLVPFTPASLALTGWWRDYPPEALGAPVPWVGTASAGASGGRTLFHGVTSPKQGSLFNGHRGADFLGSFESTNSQEGSGETLTQYVSASAWTKIYAYKVNGLNAPGDNPVANADPRASRALMDDTGNTYLCDTMDTGGFHVNQVDSGGLKTLTIAGLAVGQTNRTIAWFDGSFLNAMHNGVLQTPVACGNVASLTGFYRIGDSYSTAHFFGEVIEHGVAQFAITSLQAAAIDAYLVARYGL